MSRQRSSVRTQMAAILIILVGPGLLAFALSRHQSALRDIRENEMTLLALADAVSLGVGEFLSNSRGILESLAQDPDLSSLDPDRCPSYFPELVRLYIPTYTNLFTWTQEGEGICSVLGPEDADPSVGPPPGFEDITAAEGFHINPVHKGTSTGRWTTGLSFPLRDGEGNKVGNITLSVDLLHFQEILEELTTPSDAIISIFEKSTQTLVARSRDSELHVGSTPSSPNSVSEDDPTFSRRGSSIATNYDGREYLWGFTSIPNSPWMVYAGRPLEAVYGPLRAGWIRSGLLVLAVSLLALVLGIFLSSWITKPLAKVEQEVAATRPGDPSPLTVQGPREIAQVALRFNEAWEAWSEAEAHRQHSVERYRSLVENAVTGIYISTEAGRFLEVNQAMVDLLGFESREELLDTPVSSIYASAEDRSEALETYGHREFFRGVEVVWQDRKGKPVFVRLFGRHFRTAEGERAWEVIVEDVTKIRALQQQSLQAQKMEALGRMAGGIAHDFNNLLTVIHGRGELLLDDPSVGEDLKAQVREIVAAADRGGELNRQLLDFGRRRAGFKENVDLNQILSGFELILKRAVGEEINLDLRLGQGLGSIKGDRGRLEQVAMNLVVNAKDAMPRGGDILIETYNATLTEEEASAFPPAIPGPHVVLSVSDSGVGIEADILPSIFEPFFSTKPESQGTGLGLATVYGLVTELDGHIRVESVPEEGTSFRLFFPLSDIKPALEERPKPRPAKTSGSGLILLAEDQEAVRRITKKILEGAGYTVLAAENGQAALSLAMEHDGPFDLLVSDVVMPEMRGPELAEALSRAEKVKRALLLSGYAEGLKDSSLEGLEAWELLPKPFLSGDLLAAVKRTMGQGK